MTPIEQVVLKALNTGISSEVAAYVFYKEAAKKPQTAEFKDLLEELALEEKRHFQILEKQHASLVKSEQWISLADLLKEEGLQDIDEEMTGHHKKLIEEVQKVDSALGVLNIAYQLEVDAYEFFNSQIDVTYDPEGKKIYTELAKFEAGHMRKIDELRKQYQ